MEKIDYSDRSWIPDMPPSYVNSREQSLASRVAAEVASAISSLTQGGSFPPTLAGTETSGTPSGNTPPGRQTPATSSTRTVRPPTPVGEYTAFSARSVEVRVHEAIQRAGPLPKIGTSGAEKDFCVSYHIRGRCSSTCHRDHSVHSAADKTRVLEWCRRAYA